MILCSHCGCPPGKGVVSPLSICRKCYRLRANKRSIARLRRAIKLHNDRRIKAQMKVDSEADKLDKLHLQLRLALAVIRKQNS